MIKVSREVWNCNTGFSKKIYRLEPNREMQLVKDGEVYASQCSEFQLVEKDWNCDGDVYELYGAYFDRDGYADFITPENIVNMMIEDNVTINYLNK